MNKICTTIEQSKKLLGLGIDINTADMHYMYCHWEIDENTIGSQSDASIGFSSGFYYGEDNGKTYYYIPAWSLTALFEVLPKYIGDYSKCLYYDMGYHYCGYMVDGDFMLTIEETKADDLVDACYEMIIKLHEQELL